MKNSRIKVLLPIFTLLAIFIIPACNKESDQNITTATDHQNAYEMPGLDLLTAPLVIEASEEQEFQIVADGMPTDLDADLSEHMELSTLLNHHPLRHCDRDHLLDSLQLSTSQQTQLKRALIARHHCSRSIYAQIKRHHHKIIERARNARHNLMEDFRHGKINRHQLERAMNQLNQKTRQALFDLPDQRRLLQALRSCHHDFLSQLQQILNQRQWRLWLSFHQRCRH